MSTVLDFEQQAAELKSLKREIKSLETHQSKPHNDVMTSPVSRSELDAELRAIRSDIKASQAELRADLALMQTSLVERLSAIASSISENRAETKVEIAELRGEMSGVRGEISGLKSALTTTQWFIGLVVGCAAIVLATVQIFLALMPTPINSTQKADTARASSQAQLHSVSPPLPKSPEPQQ